MKVYVFDDKEANLNNAETAILQAGHSFAEESRKWNRKISFAAHNVLGESYSHNAYREAFGIINDAIADVKANGGGIITDLMFHMAFNHQDGPQPPSGILVALHAVAQGIPVVICTNADEAGGHHAKEISWIFDGYVNLTWKNRPFGWVENKDWNEAVKILGERSMS